MGTIQLRLEWVRSVYPYFGVVSTGTDDMRRGSTTWDVVRALELFVFVVGMSSRRNSSASTI